MLDYDWGTPPDVAGSIKGHAEHTESAPLEGSIGAGSQRFFWGIDPDSHPGHADRPSPTQTGIPAAVAAIGQGLQIQPLGFVFLQAYWDAYNTLHFRATPSETSMLQVQVAQAFDDGMRGPWTDVRGDNCIFDEPSGKWLTPPLTFHLYWNTSDRAQYPAGGSYQLRLRQVDITRQPRAFGSWVYSTAFQIIQGVSNPVSVLETTYEPWSRTIAIRLRCDDSECDAYTLTGFYYSLDDGFTWHEIGKGDISGPTAYLSSKPGENEHVVYWHAGNYNIHATGSARLRIDATPTDNLTQIQVPFFKWLSPANPAVDDAERELADILGTVQHRIYDEATGTWVKADPPVRISGILSTLMRQQETILGHPTASAADGAYSFMVQDESGPIRGKRWGDGANKDRWRMVDQAGYDAWLQDKYTPVETHGKALARVAEAISYYTNQRLPTLRKTVNAGEIRMRKRLMDQGFFAEACFAPAGNSWNETIAVKARDFVAEGGGPPTWPAGGDSRCRPSPRARPTSTTTTRNMLRRTGPNWRRCATSGSWIICRPLTRSPTASRCVSG